MKRNKAWLHVAVFFALALLLVSCSDGDADRAAAGPAFVVKPLAASDRWTNTLSMVFAPLPGTRASHLPGEPVALKSLVGAELVGFRLTHLLGEGGMAIVFRGENVLNSSIARAIKIVRPELAMREEFSRRFAEEAVILENLHHPNVVRFFGLRSAQNLLVMELELLEGAPLSTVMRRAPGQLAIRDVVTWIQQAADGVSAAHSMGVVHRDLKPDNLFLTRGGTIKVLDFGIARALDEADRGTRLTTAGTVPGTVAYLAPEVCAGATPGAAADVYALGISMFELLLGHHPFARPGQPFKSSTQLMYAHVNTALPDLRGARPEVPAQLDAVLRRATAKDPAERFANAGALSAALGGLASTLPDESRRPATLRTEFAVPTMPSGTTTDPVQLDKPSPVRPSRARRVATVGGGVVIIAAAVLVYRFVAPPTAPDGGETRPHSTGGAPSGGSRATPANDGTNERNAVGEANPWARIRGVAGSQVLLGVARDDVAGEVRGFRPARGVRATVRDYEIQTHEVTWGELEPWLAGQPSSAFARPAWLPSAAPERARLPATGVPWSVAYAYCRSTGGHLPSEEEWELAARGADRRPYPWGSDPIDLERTHAYAGAAGRVAEMAAAMHAADGAR